MRTPAARPLSLYVHLPFCRAKCPYCDFAVALYRPGRPEAYVELLVAEAELALAEGGPVPAVPRGARVATVFFGGGTPTVSPPEALRRLASELARRFDLSGVREWTVEANPEGLAPEALSALRALGADRLSIGAQTAEPGELRALGRRHLWEDVEAAVRGARRAGFGNVNLDLMFGLPGQTVASWRRTLEAAVALGPEHVSTYGLEVEPGTPFYAFRERGLLDLPDDAAQAEMYEEARAFLRAEGYEQYEISNFARPGFASRHNLVYWDNGDYLGLGLGAHSHVDGVRWGNTRNLRRYRESVVQGVRPLDPEATEVRGPAGELADAMLLGLRRLRGVSRRVLRRRFGLDPGEVFAADLRELAASGLVALGKDRIRLTRKGLLLGNLVFERFALG
ncbi:MAG: radical SAM family heme chaperone HemW [Clostridia bacterium]|nr:radical SAM family heme chaperone HemW [Clostridia bacterium]